MVQAVIHVKPSVQVFVRGLVNITLLGPGGSSYLPRPLRLTHVSPPTEGLEGLNRSEPQIQVSPP